MIDIDKLNENQQMAVKHVDGPCMVLAGPGSGKTRVITYRIVNMVMNEGIPPTRILAISFTKASSIEMKNRALSICNDFRMNKVTFGTFHAVFFRILRKFERLNLNSILDEKLKRFALKGILKSLNVENGEDDELVGQVINEISYVKNELMDKADFESEVLTKDEFINAYNMYENYKEEIKKIDFDDMLIRTYHLLQNNPQALNMVRNVYKYILIDEFQDVNRVQFEVVKLIAEPNNNIFVVGDEDQSIYGFRGARPDFLLQFKDYFKDSKEVRLDINYRSKSEIIGTANRLIDKNQNRYNKVIKCNQEGKGTVEYLTPKDSEDEAMQIAKDIQERVKEDYVEYDDFAVIYRTNLQSRALVDVFMDMRIPFVIRDSVVTIYDHWAAKDILSYLKLSINPDSNEDWMRIINKPFRYISRESINSVKGEKYFLNALVTKCNLYQKQVKTINDLDIDISYLKTMEPKNAISFIRTTLDYDKYILDYCMNRKIKPNGLIEILNEIESSSSNFNTIEEYLSHIEKVKEELQENQKNKEVNGVIFTTMHSAKGLEFDNVYIIGTNEGTIPHEKSYDIEDEDKKNNQIEEERRLMYVAITRAKNRLCISCPQNKYGKKVSISRFKNEMEDPLNSELKQINIRDKIY
ncbi:MAG: ATP-dependent helicase [Intestinibacter sp.]|uniref:ATP-dependent helicase n=2 Tax=Intestinibacter sp. TaxID=1965304 RepID=UPI0025C4527F|nr:ATP-dependent helicase [Intestinibacter sp.]MCI6736511.1 ATP-dependent helicase [Intestinibacter sp.]